MVQKHLVDWKCQWNFVFSESLIIIKDTHEHTQSVSVL